MSIVIGIDPGLTGAVAELDIDLSNVWDIPVQDNPFSTKVKKRVAAGDLVEQLSDWSGVSDMVVVYLEHQLYRPLVIQGKPRPAGGSSTFSLGDTYGSIRGALACCDFRVVEVRPTEWKKALGVTKDKDTTLAMARDLFPDIAHTHLKRKKDHNRAEALLIAHYGRLKEAGQL